MYASMQWNCVNKCPYNWHITCIRIAEVVIIEGWSELCYTPENWIKLDLQKMTFDGRQTLTEDDLQRKADFDRRRPLMKDDLWLKTGMRLNACV